MVNKEELDILKDKMVNLRTIYNEAEIKDVSVESNVLLFVAPQEGSENPEYTMYRGYNDGNVIGISATSALKLKNPVNIFGNLFDGTKEIKGHLKNVDSIDASGNIITKSDIHGNNLFLQGSIDASLGKATFKEILVDTSNGSGFIIDSSNNRIDISILNVKENVAIDGSLTVGGNITANSLNVKEFTFEEMTIDDVSFNNVSVAEKLDTSALHLDSSVLTYTYVDENNTTQVGSINFHTGKNEFEAHPITVTYDTVKDLFDAYDSSNLVGADILGTTYYVNKGLSYINSDLPHHKNREIKETFIIDNDGKLMPTSPYLIFDTSVLDASLDASLEAYNYKAAGTMIFQNVYSADAKEHYIDVPESTNIEDGTAITGSEYHRLWKAVKQIQYVLGIDMDAGNTGNTTDPANISLFGLKDVDIPTDAYGVSVAGLDSGELIDNSTDYINTYGQDAADSSIDGVILTNLYVNQKTAYTNSETEEKPAFLQAIDDLELEVNGDENTDGDIVEDDNNGETPTIPDVSYIPGEDTIITDTPDYDITNISKYFVRAIRIKRGTYSQLMDVSNYILDGELIWCKYDKNYPAQSNKLFIKTTDTRGLPYFYCINTGTDEDSEGDYLTELKDIEKIDWKTDNGSTYRTVVDNDGNMHMQSLSDNTEIIVDSGKKRSKFYINSFYFGGLDSSKLSFRPCSHNFIELSNLTGKDINLEDAKLSLQYTDRTKYNTATGKVTWEILPLKGTIKSGETFLIRGAQCGPLNCNTTRIEIDSYDMEWYDSTGKLISFDTACPSIVLYKGNVDSNGNYATCTAEVDDIWEAKYLYSGTAARSGVYDCIGITGNENGVLNAVDP